MDAIAFKAIQLHLTPLSPPLMVLWTRSLKESDFFPPPCSLFREDSYRTLDPVNSNFMSHSRGLAQYLLPVPSTFKMPSCDDMCDLPTVPFPLGCTLPIGIDSIWFCLLILAKSKLGNKNCATVPACVEHSSPFLNVFTENILCAQPGWVLDTWGWFRHEPHAHEELHMSDSWTSRPFVMTSLEFQR
jgi:hypothetical protein